MLEVFGNYDKTSSNVTYFRSIGIMDQFLKKSKRVIKNEDLHLVGIGSIFLGSKQEDVYHITLDDIYSKVGHQRFSYQQIKETEFEILTALQFKITFSTPLHFLYSYFQQAFWFTTNNAIFNQVYQMSLFVLKLTNYDVKLLQIHSHLMALSVFIYSIKTIFLELKIVNSSQQ